MASRRGFEVFVRGLPWTFSEKELARYCSQFGKVMATRVTFNKETGTHNGFGFVTFQNKEAISNLTSENIHFAEGAVMHFDPRSRRERLGFGKEVGELRQLE